jgi:cation:H+ antiporter
MPSGARNVIAAAEGALEEMLMDLGMVAAGLVLLVVAGDALVRGAINLALRVGIPPLVVGLTVVAFGTSAPELLVSVQAVLKDLPGVALGNVVGSNIANILLVLGLPALIAAVGAGEGDVQRGYLTMLAATVLFIGLAWAGPMGWVHGLVLLAGLGLMLADNFRAARAHRAALAAGSNLDGQLPDADPETPAWKIAALLAAGLIGLPIGADLLVDGAVGIARTFSVSEVTIGLTLVAVGTSLPELAATTIAAFRGNSDVAMGNIIGSNVFNLLGIIGVAALIGPLPVPQEMLRVDLWVMLGTSLLLLPMAFRGVSYGRKAGIGLIAAYGGYLVLLAGRA